LIMYVALITYTIKFTFVYLKRVLKMAFLTIVSPIVALTYPIDKLKDGKAQGFEMWLKEFIFNALLQPMHYIIYYILVTTSLTLAATNPLYGVVALMFISQAEKLLKKIFGFDKAKAGTVGGVAGAFTTGAVTGGLMNLARNPEHPISALLGGKSGGTSGSGSGNSSGEGGDNYALPEGFIDDIHIDDFIGMDMHRSSQNADTPPLYNRENLLSLMGQYQQQLDNPFITPEAKEEIQSKIETLNDVLNGGEVSSELGFDAPITGGQQSAEQSITGGQQFILSGNSSGIPGQQTQEEGFMSKMKNAPVIKGFANVGKSMFKPVWDFDKDATYNTKKLARKAVQGIVGAGIGITAATVQAGISITDGKYNLGEGVATLGAGMVGAKQLGEKSYQKVQQQKDEKSIEAYTQQWYNRDDVISNYDREFPGKGKKMRERAAKNYVSRGVTDFNEQKQALKFAEKLIEERGMDVEEADRIAAATIKYKQNAHNEVFYDEKKKEKFINSQVESYTGSASKDAVRKVHETFIQNVIDLNKANGVI